MSLYVRSTVNKVPAKFNVQLRNDEIQVNRRDRKGRYTLVERIGLAQIDRLPEVLGTSPEWFPLAQAYAKDRWIQARVLSA